MDRRDRVHRKSHTAGSLLHGNPPNRSRIERLLSGVRQTQNDGEVVIHLIMPFRRGGCCSCVRDLTLLPWNTEEAAEFFDGGLVGVQFIVGEGYLVQAVVLPSDSIYLDEAWNRLQEDVEECTKRALRAADEALLGLENSPGQP